MEHPSRVIVVISILLVFGAVYLFFTGMERRVDKIDAEIRLREAHESMSANVCNHKLMSYCAGVSTDLCAEQMVAHLTSCTNTARTRTDSASTDDKISAILDCAIKKYLNDHPNRTKQDPECVPQK
jgi:hypothetical protein